MPAIVGSVTRAAGLGVLAEGDRSPRRRQPGLQLRGHRAAGGGPRCPRRPWHDRGSARWRAPGASNSPRPGAPARRRQPVAAGHANAASPVPPSPTPSCAWLLLAPSCLHQGNRLPGQAAVWDDRARVQRAVSAQNTVSGPLTIAQVAKATPAWVWPGSELPGPAVGQHAIPQPACPSPSWTGSPVVLPYRAG